MAIGIIRNSPEEDEIGEQSIFLLFISKNIDRIFGYSQRKAQAATEVSWLIFIIPAVQQPILLTTGFLLYHYS